MICNTSYYLHVHFRLLHAYQPCLFVSSMQAMVFLYGKGFPMLGHVQSGNIFVVEKDVCKLGGYENTIVGYKTRLYRLCRNNLQHFDVIMFGTCGFNVTVN